MTEYPQLLHTAIDTTDADANSWTMIARTYASGLPSIRDQDCHALANAIWTRSCAACS